MQVSSYAPSRFEVVFDDDRSVANAGLTLTGLLAAQLGIESLADQLVRLGDRRGAFLPGRKILTLVETMVAGGDCINDVDVLRAGDSARVLDHQVMAPSTCGTFLRSFTHGHVRQLDRLTEMVLQRAWEMGAGPGSDDLTVDMDSTLCQTYGYHKQGATVDFKGKRGYHPLLATRADTGEILAVRQREGPAHTGRGADPFVRELIGRIRRAGATGRIILRADSGFWSRKVVNACDHHQVEYSITVKQNSTVQDAIAAISEDAWQTIDYPESGEAQVAETRLPKAPKGQRLIARRTRLLGAQATLWPDWRYHAFVTSQKGNPVDLDAYHRAHAVCELAIRDWKGGAGANHMPSGVFAANAAWTALTTLAHNMLRWIILLGTGQTVPVVAKTVRRRLVAIPGRITRSARRNILHLPRRWPWQQQFNTILRRLLALGVP